MANQLVPLPRKGNGTTQRVIDRLALISVPVLLGALGIVLWSLLNGVIDGVRSNERAIVALEATVGEMQATLSEAASDRWTSTQEAQQQVIQALVDTAQNEELIEAKEDLRAQRTRLEAMAIDLAGNQRRIETLERIIGTLP